MTRGGASDPVRSYRAGRHGDARRRRPPRRALRRPALAPAAPRFRLHPARQAAPRAPWSAARAAGLDRRPLREAGGGTASSASSTSTRSTRAAGGPPWQRSISAAIASSVPAARISTLPSRRLRTQPSRPSAGGVDRPAAEPDALHPAVDDDAAAHRAAARSVGRAHRSADAAADRRGRLVTGLDDHAVDGSPRGR